MAATRDVSKQSDITKMTTDPDGSFKRKASTFRDFIEKGGKFEPEKGRYHLYVSYACPWATRTIIVRKLKGLEDFIPVHVVSPRMGEHGWPFANVDAYPAADVDPLFNAEHVKDIYLRVDPNYDGRFTVPILFDTKHSTIVNNESSEIIRMFYTAFDHLLPPEYANLDLYPEPLRKEIDEQNEWVYDTVNNGVYKSGFATTSKAYEAAVYPLFESLDKLEKILEGKDYLVGDQLTEADIRLFPTIIRFDPVYVRHFKCNIRDIRSGYPNLHRWMKNLYWKNPAFKDTTNFDHIKTHYFWSHPSVNPHRIVPVGPIPHILPL
ncbi:glutathione S-transferase [Punctularia strigosozonata HHB-11173 SS5]|uniref:glutathione S-transferase n=1 Tax=Punctularia strigosozonata (strain HHB-11173) TaxID=741275 RepID=UPI0004417448|nr:glutathione S-transferase [Punctularia strigosozonata HHB-11173 SS5]EIN08215.1 glutathione S-transferase [Punctularia strigosozonata HHB-11173 SS5]